MRIAYVCSDFGVPVFGSKGASIHVQELCRALDGLGHEVLIVSPRAGAQRPRDFEPEVLELAVEADDHAAYSLLAADPSAGAAVAREVRALVYAASLRSRLTAVLREFGADVVYERYALLATAGGAAARELGIPHLLEVNSPLSVEQAAHRGLAFAETARGLERALLCRAERVVAVSRALRGWLGEVGVDPARVTILSNGVDPDRFAVGVVARAATRARLGLEDEPVVGFLGTLKPWHDVESLVRAAGFLSRAGMRLHLLVVGDGPDRHRLEALACAEGIGGSTSFVGAVPHDEVPRYLAAFDAAVASYDARPGFYFSPLKLFEYLAAGRPVVAADVGDIGHCIRSGRTGLLYPPGNVRALAEALLELLLDPPRAAALGAAGREHVRAHHTWAANAEAIVDLARAASAERVGVPAWA